MTLLVCFAIHPETDGRFDNLGAQLLLTGVGKLNAAHALSKTLARNLHITHVLNMGTAGSRVHKTGSLVCLNRFIQHDMDVSPLGFAVGTTPFDETPPVMENGTPLPGYPLATGGSGDQFVTGAWPEGCEVLDMEAYALAKVCHLEKVKFSSLKYISDGADHAAAEDWPTALKHGALALRGAYDRLLLQLN